MMKLEFPGGYSLLNWWPYLEWTQECHQPLVCTFNECNSDESGSVKLITLFCLWSPSFFQTVAFENCHLRAEWTLIPEYFAKKKTNTLIWVWLCIMYMHFISYILILSVSGYLCHLSFRAYCSLLFFVLWILFFFLLILFWFTIIIVCFLFVERTLVWIWPHLIWP